MIKDVILVGRRIVGQNLFSLRIDRWARTSSSLRQNASFQLTEVYPNIQVYLTRRAKAGPSNSHMPAFICWFEDNTAYGLGIIKRKERREVRCT